mmetsp:Transcript_16572/g.37513  ORF Transcript_16572/g.37513 Transcript_16572/m.37513 type:complete len:147 (+) Transcript_16572:2-442(+)
MFHRRATGAQVSARPAAEQVFTMERLREITNERLRMMQEAGPLASLAPWAYRGLSPEELLAVRTVWRVSRESELCADFDCCAICLDGNSDENCELIALPCEHVFCADCVCTWLARRPTCVLCKKDMRPAVAKLRQWHRKPDGLAEP